MRLTQIKAALGRTYDDVQRKHTLQMAAGLSYYFVMSFFPLLIMFAAVVAYLPIHHLFGEALDFIGRFMPKDSMGLVRDALNNQPFLNRVVLKPQEICFGCELVRNHPVGPSESDLPD
jgi:uncharacterized BrkB/YihY/UPF0761 family membrane protein